MKQLSDDAFNSGKEIKAMKPVTFHRIALSLHHLWFLALPKGVFRSGGLIYSVAQSASIDAIVLNLIWGSSEMSHKTRAVRRGLKVFLA
jgi:hypothetical protein